MDTHQRSQDGEAQQRHLSERGGSTGSQWTTAPLPLVRRWPGTGRPRSPQPHSYICVITSPVTPSNEHAGCGRVKMGFAVTIKQNKLLGLSWDPPP